MLQFYSSENLYIYLKVEWPHKRKYFKLQLHTQKQHP